MAKCTSQPSDRFADSINLTELQGSQKPVCRLQGLEYSSLGFHHMIRVEQTPNFQLVYKAPKSLSLNFTSPIGSPRCLGMRIKGAFELFAGVVGEGSG